MMHDAIRQFPKQFFFQPIIQNKTRLKQKKQAVILGMGGSHLAADCLSAIDPNIPLTIHKDYGLPPLSSVVFRETLFIASSYSGNTEEVIDGLAHARQKKLAVAIVAKGGRLLDIAKNDHLPYIEIPDTGIQPRMASGFMALAFLKLLGKEEMIHDARALAETLKPMRFEAKGRALAARLKDTVPVFYSSFRNEAIAMNWKIKCNETGKIPAFFNSIPEMNHNEMTGFDAASSSKHLSERFFFCLLTDTDDHPRVQKRMRVLARLYRKRGLRVVMIPLLGKSRWDRLFSSLILADWTALSLADLYGLESEQVPMVEEFKALMR